MSHHIDDEDDDLRSPQDRELTLSTTAILGIFLGLVLLCGLFFAFGYNMGSHHNSSSTDSSEPSAPSSSTPATSFNSFKPAAGSPAASSNSTTTYPAAAANSPSTAASTATARPTDTPTTATTHAPIIVVDHSLPQPTPAPAQANGTFVVQVAAVSPTHQEDADMLVSDLHSKGYAVAAHTSPSDQLIHIQVGPFTSRAAAEAMRQRLQTDGFNAIIK